MIERLITTEMSANILNDLRKRGWTRQRIAKAIKAPMRFVKGVEAKLQVLTLPDIEALAERTDDTAELLILNSMTNIRPEVQPLVDSTRRVLEASADFRKSLRGRKTKRRARTRAA
jgi:hypothetical protein